ncbi:hypothetical protein SOASR029_08860 [Budvicia aquatica]|nr:hypothetical protein SOASR029_08860 [Budvicia aquatica]
MMLYSVVYFVLIAIISWTIKKLLFKNKQINLTLVILFSLFVFGLSLGSFLYLEAFNMNAIAQQMQLPIEVSPKPNFLMAFISSFICFSILRSKKAAN